MYLPSGLGKALLPEFCRNLIEWGQLCHLQGLLLQTTDHYHHHQLDSDHTSDHRYERDASFLRSSECDYKSHPEVHV